MRVVALQEADRNKLRDLASEREECYKRFNAARVAYDGLLKALATAAAGPASNSSYKLDESENFLVLGNSGEWQRL